MSWKTRGGGYIARRVTGEVLVESIKETILLENLSPGCTEMRAHRAISGFGPAMPIRMPVRYFRREELRPLEDCAGVRHWGVSLDRTMLTYFELDPNVRFELHRHDSEQITFVLEGTLFFEIDGRTSAVESGEVVAIPSRVPHVVFTGDAMVKAIDAWSPIVEEYVKIAEGFEAGDRLPNYRDVARVRIW